MTRQGIARAGAVCVLALGVVLGGVGVAQWLRVAADTARLGAVLAGRDAAVSARPAVLRARAHVLIGRGNLDDAQVIADRLTGDPAARQAVLYELGNARLRRGMALFGQVPFRVVRPFLGLAKSDYRQALQIDPQDWDARYNYALAAALLPDSETFQRSAGARMSHDRAVWPDIPGVPNGMP